MKNWLFTLGLAILAFLFLFVAVAYPNNPENLQVQPAPAGPGIPDLNGFLPVDEYGITWDCSKSGYLFADGDVKQVITASGDNLLFYCQLGEPMVKFCENGILKRPDGMHDDCK